MASRGQRGAVLLVALGSLALQACIAVPVRGGYAHRARPGYGYGGSGLVSEVDPRAAQDECFRAARDFRGYRGVRVGSVDITGPETARVDLSVRAWRGYSHRTCTYDARTGRAYVP